MSDEEFDEEAYKEYENELYHADSSGDDSDVDSEIADAIYGEVHYATALDIPETPQNVDTECSKISIDKPQLVQSGDTCSGSDSDFDNASGSKSNAGVAKATFYVVSSCESSDASSEKDLQEVDSFIVVEDIDGVSDKELPPGKRTSTKLPVITVCSSSNSEVSDGEIRSPSLISVESGEIIAEDPTEENWDLDEKDLIGNKGKTAKTVSRYYRPRPSGNPHIRCYNCNEKGHRSNECPQPKKADICILCGITGHLKWKCPKELCFNCDEPGHQSRACRKPRKRPYDSCHRCYMKGHMQSECPDLWRQFHRTTRPGRVVEPSTAFKPSGSIYCYNCSKQGHYGHECVEDRMEKHISPASPFVVNYGDCYACRKRPRHGEAKQQNRLDRLDRTHKRHSWPSHRDSHHWHTDDLGHVGDGRDVQAVTRVKKHRRQGGEDFRGHNPDKMPRRDWRDESDGRGKERDRDRRNLEYGYGGSGEDESRTPKRRKKKKSKKNHSDVFPEEPINGNMRSVEIVSGLADFYDDGGESYNEPKRKKKKKRQVDGWIDRDPVQEELYERPPKRRDQRRVWDGGDGRKNVREKREFRGSLSWRPGKNPGFASDRGFRFGAGSKADHRNNQKHRHKRLTR